MDFGEVLSSAWKIIWKHKVLWIFGILASCGSANGGTGNLGNSVNWTMPAPIEDYSFQFEQIPEWQIILVMVLILIVVLLLALLAIFLSTLGRIGMIRGTQQADDGKEQLILGELLSDSLPYFWRVLGLYLLFGLVMLVFFVLFFLVFGVFAVITFGLAVLCLIPLLCILVPLIWFVGIVIEQSAIAIVVEDIGIMEGIRRGWGVVSTNLGPIIAMGLILVLGLGFIASFVIGLPFLFIMAPIIVGTMSGSGEFLGGGFVVAAVCFCLYLPVVILLSGVLRAYISSAWTLAYLRLTRDQILPEPDSAPNLS